MTTILIWSDQCFFLWLCSFVSYDNALFRKNTKHTKLAFACKSQFRETQNFAKQGVFFREIRQSFRMKISRILYERNSSVNPSTYSLKKQVGPLDQIYQHQNFSTFYFTSNIHFKVRLQFLTFLLFCNL